MKTATLSTWANNALLAATANPFVISLTNGDVVNWIRFEGDISEIFDISFLPNVKNPMMIGLRTPEIRDLITFESELQAEASAA